MIIETQPMFLFALKVARNGGKEKVFEFFGLCNMKYC
jgi:hypothetical protein